MRFLSVFLLILMCGTSLGNGWSENEYVKENPCLKNSLQKSINLLWNVPYGLSDTLLELRYAVKLLLKRRQTTRVLAYLTSLSLWTLDHFTGMPTPVHPSCIFSKLVNETVSEIYDPDYHYNYKQNLGLRSAQRKYGRLCYSGIDNTIYVGMELAGCAVDVPRVKTSPPCYIGTAPYYLLADPYNEIPHKLRRILKKLLLSNNPDDVAVAAFAFGVGTESSLDFFETQLRNDVFIKLVQLKGCTTECPGDQCCTDLKETLLDLAAREKEVVDNYYMI